MENITGILKGKKDDIYTIVASSKQVDRDNEIILPSAFKNLDSYLKHNPGCTWPFMIIITSR